MPNINLVEQLAGVVIAEANNLTIKANWIKNPSINNGIASCDLVLPFPCQSWHGAILQQLTAVSSSLSEVEQVQINISTKVDSHVVQGGIKLIPQVKNIVAVASGKGGVGKSTTAVNLALALQDEGAKVGVLDADIYGPSVPTMLGVSGAPASLDGKSMQPLENYGLQIISIGLLIKPNQAMIWRGPMAVQALEQLLRQTNWQELDYLIIDMPPGTGDIQLTLSQRVPVTGAVIVSTPQDIALLDARKAINMFEKVNVPILGIVENMAIFQCSNCGHQEHIFGQDGGKELAKELAIDYLDSLPLQTAIRLQADSGKPTVVAEPNGSTSAIYRNIARQIAIKIADKAKDFSAKFPTISISKDS